MRRLLLGISTLLLVALGSLLLLPTTNAQFTSATQHPNSWRTRTSFYTSPVDLGSAGSFSVLGYTGVTNSDATILSGDLGVSPSTSIVGFPPGIVNGSTHRNDSAAQNAQTDLAKAYQQILHLPSGKPFGGDLNGKTFTPGYYHTAAAFTLTGKLTFDAQNDPNAIFIFQVDAAWNTAASSTMVLANGALASHIFYQVTGAAGTGALSSTVGTVLAAGAITAGAGSTIHGQLLSQGLVTLSSNTIGP